MKKILKGAVGFIGSTILGLDKKKDKTPEPTPQAPAVMPAPDDEEVRRARRMSIARQLGRRGRESTILTGDTLGGS